MTPSTLPSVQIIDFRFDRSFYHPDETVRLAVTIYNHEDEPVSVRMRSSIVYIQDETNQHISEFTLERGEGLIDIELHPPPDAPRGYGVDVCLESEAGEVLECISTAFDVLDHWTQNPRYGFLTDFSPERSDYDNLVDHLLRFHINGLQFYDWMYRHDQFLTDVDPYLDPLGRRLSVNTVENLIQVAHSINTVAMPYTAIYAASIPFFNEHPGWALYRYGGQPYYFGDNFLAYMDPRPDSLWVEHLMAQFEQILNELDFDGIHLDQYGDPKEAYDAQGERFSLAQPLADTIDRTKELVLRHRTDGAVVFNAVTNWPIETVSKSDQDFTYIEVWSPYTWFADLHGLIAQAQDLSGGKPVVLAAYIDPEWEHNVRLVDAIIFASGGGHIELGEINGMLSDPYFPEYQSMSSGFIELLRRYYDFAIRYQNLIGPGAMDRTPSFARRVRISGVSSSSGQLANKVLIITRESEGFTAISLINLLGVNSPDWNRLIREPPTPLENATVHVSGLSQDVSGVYVATPDREQMSLQPIDFIVTQEAGLNRITFILPHLEYWDLIVIEWEK